MRHASRREPHNCLALAARAAQISRRPKRWLDVMIRNEEPGESQDQAKGGIEKRIQSRKS